MPHKELEGLEPRQIQDGFNPTTWKDLLSSKNQPFNYDDLTPKAFAEVMEQTNAKAIANFLKKHPTLAIATIAGGKSGRVNILHHFTQMTNDDDSETVVALSGTSSHANIIEIDISQMSRKKHDTWIPSSKFIINLFASGDSFKDKPTAKDEHGSTLSIPNSIILQPHVLDLMLDRRVTSTQGFLQTLIEDSINKMKTSMANPPDSIEDILDMVDVVPNDILTRLVYAWSISDQTKSCFSVSMDEMIQTMQATLHKKLTPQLHSGSKQSANEMSSKPPSTEPKKQNEPSSTPRSSNKSDGKPPAEPEKQNERPTNEATNEADDSRYTIPPGLPPTDTRDIILSQFTVQMAKQNQIQERILTQQALHFQAKAEGKRALHSTVSDYYLRLATRDGIEPAPAMTKLAKDVLMSNNDAIAAHLIELELNAGGTKGICSAQMVSSLRNGTFDSKNSFHPSGLSLYQCATSFSGSILAQYNIVDILRRYAANEPLSQTEKDVIHKEVLNITRTATELTKNCKVLHGVIAAFFDPRSTLLARYVNTWKIFLLDQEDHLAEIIHSVNPDLALQIQWHISWTMNQFVRTAKFEVPDGETLDPSSTFSQIKTNTFSGFLPPAIQKLLSSTNTPEGKLIKQLKNQDTEKTLSGHKHKPQPEALKSSRLEMQQIKTHGHLKIADVPTLWYNEGKKEEECFNYCYAGHCYAHCRRKASHKPVEAGSQRYDKLLKYKKDCCKRAGNPDFA